MMSLIAHRAASASLRVRPAFAAIAALSSFLFMV